MQTERKITSVPNDAFKRPLTMFAALCVSALLGVLFGALSLCYVSDELSEALLSMENGFFSVRANGDFTAILFDSLSANLIFLGISFFLGFGALSQPLSMLLPFARGIGSGVILAQIYGDSFKDFSPLKAAVVLPGIAVSLIIVILASREAIFMSVRIFKICFRDRLSDGLFPKVKNYSAKFVFLLAAASAAALADCVLSLLLFR